MAKGPSNRESLLVFAFTLQGFALRAPDKLLDEALVLLRTNPDGDRLTELFSPYIDASVEAMRVAMALNYNPENN